MNKLQNKKASLITDGKDLLARHIFPVELLASIKEKRLRDEVLRGILDDGKQFSQLSDHEKGYRAKRLKLELAATDYLEARDRFIPTAIALLLLGLITLILSVIGLNTNLPFGIALIIQSVILLMIGLIQKEYNHLLAIISLGIGASLLLEIAVFGFPEQLAPTTLISKGVEFKIVGIIPFLIELTPSIFLILRLGFWLSIFRLHLANQKLIKSKEEFLSTL